MRAKDTPAVAVGSAKTRLIEVGGDWRYLGEDEQIRIANWLREKAWLPTIATEPGQAPSTVSREVRRNAHAVSGDYRLH